MNETITIAEAQKRYRELGRESVYPGYRDVVERLVRDNFRGEIPNDSYADALFLTDVMFSNSKTSVRMLTGDGCDGFFETLESSLSAMLFRLKQSGGFFKIIVLAEKMPQTLDRYCREYSGTLDASLGRATQQMKHFIVCDSAVSRMEQPHGELTPETLATEIKATVSFSNPVSAKRLESYFDALWGVLSDDATQRRAPA